MGDSHESSGRVRVGVQGHLSCLFILDTRAIKIELFLACT